MSFDGASQMGVQHNAKEVAPDGDARKDDSDEISQANLHKNEREVVGNAMRGLSALVSVQVGARVLSFALKAAAARVLGPVQFAFSEVKLMLLISLALLPSREGFRKIAIRADSHEAAAFLACAASACTLLFSVLAYLVTWYVLIPKQEEWSRAHSLALQLSVVAAVIEGLAEPAVVSCTRFERYRELAVGKSVAVVAGSLSALLALYFLPLHLHLAASALGQVCFSICLLASLLLLAARSSVSFHFPRIQRVQGHVGEYGGLLIQQLYQAMVRFFLRDGEGLVLMATCSPDEQGSFKLASNLASLVARFFFEPVEEQCFAAFSRLNVVADHGNPPNRSKALLVERTLGVALKTVSIVALTLALIGPSFSTLFIRILYGTKWAFETRAPEALSAYFVYLVFMALNGVSEAFLNATATSRHLQRYSLYTSILSVAYLAGSFVLAGKLGSVGLVLANCINMAARFLYCCWYISVVLHSRLWLNRVLLRSRSIAALVIASALSGISSLRFTSVTSTLEWEAHGLTHVFRPISIHICAGAASVALVVGTLYTSEADFLNDLRHLYKTKSKFQ